MKKTSKKEMRIENKQFRAKVKEGKLLGYWVNQKDCAEKIGIPRSTFGGYAAGFIHGENVLLAIAAMQKLIDAAPPPSIPPASTEHPLQDLLQRGKDAGLWKAISSCANVLKKDRDTISRYLDMEKEGTVDDSTMRERAYYAKLLAAMRRKLSKGSAAPPGDLPPERGHPSAPDGVVASPYYDRLLAGVAEFEDQNLGGVRFVLTQRNFKRLKGVVTKQEVADTKLLIEELRRRLNLVAQNSDEEVRALCYRELGQELEALLNAAEIVQEVIPTAAVARLEKLRKSL
jgi:hypothetical protein